MDKRSVALILLLAGVSFAAFAKVEETSRTEVRKRPRCERTKSCAKKEAPPRKYRGAFSGGPLDGSYFERKRSLAHENLIADELRLPRFQKLEDIIAAHPTLRLVPEDAPSFYIDDHVDQNRRYLQKWTYEYLAALAEEFKNENAMTADYPKLKITSMVRDLDYQLHRVKSAAKCKEPETCSTHLTGATFDISFKNMSRQQYKWMYERLTRDRDLGIVNAIHEPWSGCFHVFVLPPEDQAAKAQK